MYIEFKITEEQYFRHYFLFNRDENRTDSEYLELYDKYNEYLSKYFYANTNGEFIARIDVDYKTNESDTTDYYLTCRGNRNELVNSGLRDIVFYILNGNTRPCGKSSGETVIKYNTSDKRMLWYETYGDFVKRPLAASPGEKLDYIIANEHGLLNNIKTMPSDVSDSEIVAVLAAAKEEDEDNHNLTFLLYYAKLYNIEPVVLFTFLRYYSDDHSQK